MDQQDDDSNEDNTDIIVIETNDNETQNTHEFVENQGSSLHDIENEK